MFHCHIEFHAEVGMSLIFKVGEHKDMLPVPRNFPLCGNWQPEDIQFKSSSLNVLSNTTKKSIIETSNVTTDEITENSIKQFIKVLPEVLRTLQISSSAISVVPYSLVSFYSFIVIIYTFI